MKRTIPGVLLSGWFFCLIAVFGFGLEADAQNAPSKPPQAPPKPALTPAQKAALVAAAQKAATKKAATNNNAGKSAALAMQQKDAAKARRVVLPPSTNNAPKPVPAPVPEVVEEQPQTPNEKKLEGLPFDLPPIEDEQGHRWDPLNCGALVKGSGGFNGVMLLVEGDSEFEATEVWQNEENSSYRMVGKLPNVGVERRLRVFKELGAARFVDVFHNSSNADITLNLTYRVWMSFEMRKIYTSRGRDFSGKLGMRDFGLAIEAPEGADVPGALLVVAQERRLKPTIEVGEDGKSLSLNYTVYIKKGQKRALMNWVAQKDITGAENIAEHFAPIYHGHRLVAPAPSSEIAELIANFPAGGAGLYTGAGYLLVANELSSQFNLKRIPESDKIRMQDSSDLDGEATGSDLKVASRFGEIIVPQSDVAILQGGGGIGRPHRVYLRNGNVLAGQVSAEGLGVKGGFEVSLSVAQLNYLTYRLREDDGDFPFGTDIFVELYSGDVISLIGAEDLQVGLITPWGKMDVALSEIDWMRHVSEPTPRYRVGLTDGTQMTVFIESGELTAQAGGLDEVTISTTDILSMWNAENGSRHHGIGAPTGFTPGMTGGAVLLTGGNMIGGEIAPEELSVRTGSAITTVKTADVMRLHRTGQGSGLAPVFRFTLKEGEAVTGMFQDPQVELRSGERTWKVPVQHFVAMRSKDAPPEAAAKTQAKKSAIRPVPRPVVPTNSRSSSRRVVLPPPPSKP